MGVGEQIRIGKKLLTARGQPKGVSDLSQNLCLCEEGVSIGQNAGGGRGQPGEAADSHESCSHPRVCDAVVSAGEFQRPGADQGEGEVAAAMRLMRRVMQRVPRAFSVVILDSLYARAAVVKLLLKHHKDVIPVLKDERRDLLQDARGLFDVEPPKEFTRGRTHYQQWDIEGFTIWPQVGRPMRVVPSLETTTRRERKGKKWKTTSTTRDWVWTTGQASTQAIVELGHARWRIENQGFNELCTFWHFDHVFRHDPNAILGLLLTLALAFNLFHAFWALNLKRQLRCRHTKIYWGHLLTASW